MGGTATRLIRSCDLLQLRSPHFYILPCPLVFISGRPAPVVNSRCDHANIPPLCTAQFLAFKQFNYQQFESIWCWYPSVKSHLWYMCVCVRARAGQVPLHVACASIAHSGTIGGGSSAAWTLPLLLSMQQGSICCMDRSPYSIST